MDPMMLAMLLRNRGQNSEGNGAGGGINPSVGGVPRGHGMAQNTASHGMDEQDKMKMLAGGMTGMSLGQGMGGGSLPMLAGGALGASAPFLMKYFQGK